MFLAQVQHLKHLGEVNSSIWIIETQLLDNSRSLLLTHRDEAIQFNNLNLTHFDKNCQNHRHFDNFMPYVSGLGFRIGIGNLPVLRSNFGGEISTELGGIATSRATRCPCAKFGSDIQILSRIQPELFFFVLPCSCVTHVPWFSNTTEFCSFSWKSNHKFPMWFTKHHGLSKGVVTWNERPFLKWCWTSRVCDSVCCSFIRVVLFRCFKDPRVQRFQICLDFNLGELLQVGVSPNRSFQ